MKCVYHAQPWDSLRLPRQISGHLSQDKHVPVLFLLCMFSLFFMASYPRLLCPRSPRATMCIHLIPFPLSLSRCRCCVKMSRSRPRVTPSLKALLGLHAVSRCPAFHNFITLRANECRTARPPLPARFAKLTNLKTCPL